MNKACQPFYQTNMINFHRWAAYVAGAVLVLMTEMGVQFEDSISMLVPPVLYLCYKYFILANKTKYHTECLENFPWALIT